MDPARHAPPIRRMAEATIEWLEGGTGALPDVLRFAADGSVASCSTTVGVAGPAHPDHDAAYRVMEDVTSTAAEVEARRAAAFVVAKVAHRLARAAMTAADPLRDRLADAPPVRWEGVALCTLCECHIIYDNTAAETMVAKARAGLGTARDITYARAATEAAAAELVTTDIVTLTPTWQRSHTGDTSPEELADDRAVRAAGSAREATTITPPPFHAHATSWADLVGDGIAVSARPSRRLRQRIDDRVTADGRARRPYAPQAHARSWVDASPLKAKSMGGPSPTPIIACAGTRDERGDIFAVCKYWDEVKGYSLPGSTDLRIPDAIAISVALAKVTARCAMKYSCKVAKCADDRGPNAGTHQFELRRSGFKPVTDAERRRIDAECAAAGAKEAARVDQAAKRQRGADLRASHGADFFAAARRLNHIRRQLAKKGPARASATAAPTESRVTVYGPHQALVDFVAAHNLASAFDARTTHCCKPRFAPTDSPTAKAWLPDRSNVKEIVITAALFPGKCLKAVRKCDIKDATERGISVLFDNKCSVDDVLARFSCARIWPCDAQVRVVVGKFVKGNEAGGPFDERVTITKVAVATVDARLQSVRLQDGAPHFDPNCAALRWPIGESKQQGAHRVPSDGDGV
eukprot:gene10153-9227_t